MYVRYVTQGLVKSEGELKSQTAELEELWLEQQSLLEELSG